MKSNLGRDRKRLLFLVVLLAVLIGIWYRNNHFGHWGGFASVPTVKESELIDVADPDTVFHRTDIPPDQNAWPLIMDALKLIPMRGSRWSDYDANMPFADQLSGLEAAAGKLPKKTWNAALDAVAVALRKSGCQMPSIKDVQEDNDYLRAFKLLGKAFVGRATDELAHGQSDKAAADLAACRKLGIDIERGGGTFAFHYVAGMAVTGFADRGVQVAAADRHWRPSDLRALLAEWDRTAPTGDALANCLRVEFTDIFIHRLATITSFKQWWMGVIDSSDPVGNERRLNDAMAQVVEGNKDPFDRIETARDTSKVYDICIRNLTLPWDKQLPTESYKKDWRAGWPLNIADLAAPDSGALVKKLHDEMRDVRNPIGKLFAVDWEGIMDAPAAALFRDRAHWTATRIIVAARLYAAEHGGAFPRTLDEISGGSYLQSAPIDPYSTKGFHYDPVRQIIWSVGQDGRDDGGSGRPGGAATEKDMVWRVSGEIPVIPQAPRPKPGAKKMMMRPMSAGGMRIGAPKGN